MFRFYVLFAIGSVLLLNSCDNLQKNPKSKSAPEISATKAKTQKAHKTSRHKNKQDMPQRSNESAVDNKSVVEKVQQSENANTKAKSEPISSADAAEDVKPQASDQAEAIDQKEGNTDTDTSQNSVGPEPSPQPFGSSSQESSIPSEKDDKPNQNESTNNLPESDKAAAQDTKQQDPSSTKSSTNEGKRVDSATTESSAHKSDTLTSKTTTNESTQADDESLITTKFTELQALCVKSNQDELIVWVNKNMAYKVIARKLFKDKDITVDYKLFCEKLCKILTQFLPFIGSNNIENVKLTQKNKSIKKFDAVFKNQNGEKSDVGVLATNYLRIIDIFVAGTSLMSFLGSNMQFFEDVAST
ncbi:MAG: hypothetical protein LBD36_03155 [Holosporales bacterium]|jgi:hypothetical protein|nr:hypothetical protein [Holosporales bacterium]